MYEEDRVRALAMYNSMFDETDDETGLLQLLVSPTRQAVNLARSYDARERKLQAHAQAREAGETAEEEPSYRLPDAGPGGPVKNWFLAEDDFRREGYCSIQSTAQDLLNNPAARSVLEKYIPALVRFMTEKNVIPLGLALKSILSRDADESLDVKALNAELNQIPDTEA